MKLINIVRLAFAFIFPLMICFQQIIFPMDMPKKSIETKLTKLAGNIASAKEKMNNAREQLLDPEIDLNKDKENIKIIIEQNQIIANAEHIVKKSNEILMKELSAGQEEPGYFDTLKDIGSGIFNRIKSFYSYPDDEKEIAQQIINGLEEQKKLITQEIASKVKGLLPILRDAWLARYNAIVEQFDTEIYKQQIITGQAMSFGKKVALATITGAVAAGLALASKSETESEEKPLEMPKKKLEIPLEEVPPSSTVPQTKIIPKVKLSTKPRRQRKLSKEKKKQELITPTPKEIAFIETTQPEVIIPEETLKIPEEVKLVPEQETQPRELPKEKEETPEVQKEIPIQKTEEISGDFLQRATTLYADASKRPLLWPSWEQIYLKNVTKFIHDRLRIFPTDSRALDYLNQLEAANEKVIEAENDMEEFKKPYGSEERFGATLTPEGKVFTEKINTAKADRENLLRNIGFEINDFLEHVTIDIAFTKDEQRMILGSEVAKLVDQLDKADKKVNEAKKADENYKNKVGWLNYWILLQDEGMALTKELNDAKAERKKIADEIIAKIAAKVAQ